MKYLPFKHFARESYYVYIIIMVVDNSDKKGI